MEKKKKKLSEHERHSENPFFNCYMDEYVNKLMKIALDQNALIMTGDQTNKLLCLEYPHSLRLLLFITSSEMEVNGSVYLDIDEFMKYGNISKQTVYRALRYLLKMNHIAKHPARSRYYINPEYIWSESLIKFMIHESKK